MSRRMRTVVAALALFLPLAGVWSSAQDKSASDKKGPEIVATLKGHTEAVYSVSFSQDGKYLATGSFDNTIKLWETATGKEVKTFGGPQGHTKMVLSVAFSNDGTMIASGGVDNTAKVWDVPVSTPLRTLAASEGAHAVALSPDGAKLAVGTKDGLVKLFNVADFKELAKMEGHVGAVNALSFSANGQVLASAGADRTVRFWNAANGQLIAAVGAHSGAVNNVAIHANNTAASSVGDDGQLKIWTVPPVAARTLPAHAASILGLFVTADGNQVLTASADKTVRHALTAGKEVRSLTGPNAAVTSVALNPQGNLIAGGTADSRLYLWTAADGKPVTNYVAHGGSVTGVHFHPQQPQLITTGSDGLVKTWAVPPAAPRILPHPDAVLVSVPGPNNKLFTGGGDKTIRVWDLAKLTVERQLTGHAGAVTALAVSGNGQLLISGGAEGTMRFWNVTAGKESDILTGHTGAVTSLALNAAGSQLVSTSLDGKVKLWQLPLTSPKAMAHPEQVTAVAVSADGAKLLTGGGDKQARLWDLAKGVKERDYSGPTLAITSVALSADGKLLAAGAADKTVHVWSVGDGKVLQKIGMPAAVQSVAFSPDAKFVVAGLADGAIKVHGAGDGKEVKALAGHKGAVTALAFSRKGDVVYSASADKSVQAWAMPEGAAKTRLEHVGPVTGLALSADGTKLVAVADKTVKVWNTADGKETGTLTAPAEIKGVALSPDNTRVALAGADKLARIYELSGELVEAFAHDGAVNAVAFVNPKTIVSGAADKLAKVWTSGLVWQKSHAAPVRQALFSPKGDQVLAAGDDKTVTIWNAADGKQLRSIAAHEAAIASLALAVDGSKLITAGVDKAVKVWNLAAKPGTPEENKPAAVFTVAAAPQSLALSPNGARLAVGVGEKEGNTIRVFDLILGRELQVIAEHAGPITSLAFLGDNRTLLTGSQDKSARLLDVNILGAFEAHKDGVVAAQLNGTGTQLLTAGGDKIVKLWDLTKNAVVKTFGPVADPIRSAGFNRDFTQVAVASGKTLKVWNVADGKDVLNVNHPADVLSFSFSVDKTKVATGAADKLTRVFDVAGGKELQFFPQDDAVSGVVFLPPNNAIVSAGGKTPRVDTLAISRVIAADAGPVHGLALNPPGTHVLTAGADKNVKMWNLANGNLEKTFAGAGASVRSIAVAKNNTLVAAGGDEGVVRVYNVADGKELGVVKATGPVKTLTFTPNSAIVVAACADKSLLSWNVPFQAGQPLSPDFLKTVQNFAAADVINDLTIAADNATIFTAGANKAVHAWKLASPNPTRNFPHPNNVDAVAFQPNGVLFATGCHDGKVRIYDLVKGAVVKEINAHPGKDATMIYTIAFSPDGKQLVSGSYDQSLKLWDVATGNLVREFKAYKVKEFEKGHEEGIFSAAFSPDGKLLASGSGGQERVIKIWDVATGNVVRDLVNPNIKTAPGKGSSHPGWVYNMRFTKDGKHLVSVGDAPLNKGFLAIWNPSDGKLLYSEVLPLGSFFSVAVSPNDELLAIGAGPRGRPTPEFNAAYLMKLPKMAN